MALGCAACLPQNPHVQRTIVVLVDHSAWSVTPEADDPLASHRPAEIECEENLGWLVEPFPIPALELDTDDCNYAALDHPILYAVAAGDPIFVELFYFDLTSPEPATAHLAVLLGDETLWEDSIEIPSEAAVVELELEAPADFAQGTPLRVHLHNHGQNTWHVLEVEAEVVVP